jgi:predicted RNase H-like nuclease (RuvC/YqgF family)
MNDMIITTIVSTLTAVSGFWYGWKKNKQDVTTISLNNILAQVTIYERIIENLRDEITILIQKIEAQNETIKELETKVESMVSKTKRLNK